MRISLRRTLVRLVLYSAGDATKAQRHKVARSNFEYLVTYRQKIRSRSALKLNNVLNDERIATQQVMHNGMKAGNQQIQQQNIPHVFKRLYI